MPLKFPGSPKQRVLCPKYRIDFDIFWCIKILREENSREENSQEENRREENRHKVGIYVQLLDQAGNTKSGYLRIFNILTRVITRDLTTEFFLK